MKAARIEVFFSAKDSQWHWHLKAPNGKIICQGEGHKRKSDCYRAIDGVFMHMPNAEVQEVTE